MEKGEVPIDDQNRMVQQSIEQNEAVSPLPIHFRMGPSGIYAEGLNASGNVFEHVGGVVVAHNDPVDQDLVPVPVSSLQSQQLSKYQDALRLHPTTGKIYAVNRSTVHHYACGGSQGGCQDQGHAHAKPGESQGLNGNASGFNHAIEYVNKIKTRFQLEPDKYKQFLEILHLYQKQQRNKDDPSSNFLTENDVYTHVAKLFENQTDLLEEFTMFLPEKQLALPAPAPTPISNANGRYLSAQEIPTSLDKCPPSAIKHISLYLEKPSGTTSVMSNERRNNMGTSASSWTKLKANVSTSPRKNNRKSTPSLLSHPILGDDEFSNQEDAFNFNKIFMYMRARKFEVYFLRVMHCFNVKIFSNYEVKRLVVPFLPKSDGLISWFKKFVGRKHGPRLKQIQREEMESSSTPSKLYVKKNKFYGEDKDNDLAYIDVSTLKRTGSSYCSVPKNIVLPTCSARTQLCDEVLNDSYISAPLQSTEDNPINPGTPKKSYLEDTINRFESHRIELDYLLETNHTAILCLSAVANQILQMTMKEREKFKLDDCLGGTSVIHNKLAIRKIYGSAADDIIDSLKCQPHITVPVVLKRLQQKADEWKRAKAKFQKNWREEIERINNHINERRSRNQNT